MLGLDYGFLRDGAVHDEPDQDADDSGQEEPSGRKKHGGTTVIMGGEAKYGLGLAMVVPSKGVSEDWVARRLAGWLNDLGEAKVIVKGDNEPSMLALLREIRRHRARQGATLIEYPPEGAKQSNSHAESAVGTIKGMIRTLISSTEKRLGIPVGPAHPLVPWIVEQAAHLRNHHQVGETDERRSRGSGADGSRMSSTRSGRASCSSP